MFNVIALPIPIYLADSILSGSYVMGLLKARLPQKLTRLMWIVLYFFMEILFFEVFGFVGSLLGIVVNLIGIFAIQMKLMVASAGSRHRLTGLIFHQIAEIPSQILLYTRGSRRLKRII